MQGQRCPKRQRLPRSQKQPTATVLEMVEVLEMAEVPEEAGVLEVTELPRGTATTSVIFGGPMQQPVFFDDLYPIVALYLGRSRGEPPTGGGGPRATGRL